MAEKNLTSKQVKDILQASKDLAEIQQVDSPDKIYVTKGSFEDLAREIVKGTYEANEKIAKIFENSFGRKLYNEVVSQKEEMNRFSSKMLNKDWWLGKDQSMSGLESLARARSVGSGLNSLMEGQISTGLNTIASAIPSLSKFLSGPLYIAINVLIKGLHTLDQSIAKMNTDISSSTGGRFSNLLYKAYGSKVDYLKNIKDDLSEYNRSSEYAEVMNSVGKSFAIELSKPGTDFNKKIYGAYGAARTSFESIGMDKQFADKFLKTLILGENIKDPDQAITRIDRLIQKSISKGAGVFSPEQLMQTQLSLFEQVKKFGLNMDWTTDIVGRFSEELEKGTVTLSNFASINAGMKQGETSQLAGIGMMMVQNALASGVDVPKELINNMNDPLAFSWNIRQLAGKGDPRLLKMLSASMPQMTNQMGLSDDAAKEFLYGIGNQFTFGKLSQPQIEKIVSSGFSDFAGAYGVNSGNIRYKKEDIDTTKESIKDFSDKITSYSKQLAELIKSGTREIYSDIVNGRLGSIPVDVKTVPKQGDSLGSFMSYSMSTMTTID